MHPRRQAVPLIAADVNQPTPLEPAQLATGGRQSLPDAVRLTRREPAAGGYAKWAESTQQAGTPGVGDSTLGRPPPSSDAGPATRQRVELTPGGKESEPFEDRHNGAASLGIP